MRVSWNFHGLFHIEREPDLVVIRPQWGNLVILIGIGCAFIAGAISISVKAGEPALWTKASDAPVFKAALTARTA